MKDKADRERERRMCDVETEELSDADLCWWLRKAYAIPTIPPCHICGGKLSIQRLGGGEPTVYACTGTDEHGDMQPGRSFVDRHYSDSHYTDRSRGGDERVLELIARYERKAAEPATPAAPEKE